MSKQVEFISGPGITITPDAVNRTLTFAANASVLLDTTPITLTVAVENLQAAIDALPKLLMKDVIINVQSGAADVTINIGYFCGTGSIQIIGGSVSVRAFMIEYNTLLRIEISKFNIVGSNEYDCSVSVYYNTSLIKLAECNAVFTGNYGVFATNTPHLHVYGCTFSKKVYAITALSGNIYVDFVDGANNTCVFSAIYGGVIFLTHTHYSITGDSIKHTLEGGRIFEGEQVECWE